MNTDHKDAARGLYDKYRVERTDGRDKPGEKHEGCEYFVLDLNHDPHAYDAIRAYARSCATEFPKLADDLTLKASKIGERLIVERADKLGIKIPDFERDGRR